ncbi:MAG: acetate--CoA ligase family protein [bacterium]|nr:MAG: acetate--CoA ligase family protein [bacterium]
MDLNPFFKPKSIAIIGASRKAGSLGQVFFEKLLHYGYRGTIYPVNPQTTEINGIHCYPSVENLPEIPDLAIILVRKELAIEATESCAKKGIKHLVMITAGFREIGGEGIKREKQLLKLIRKYKIRLIGPNCMGIINTDPAICMNASFSPTEPYQGNVAFISQSGALGVAVLEMSKLLHLGFSVFVSEGNKADLVDHHFLQFLDGHEPTKVITLYLESIEESDLFRQIAQKLAKKKPIIALKAGSSSSGASAAASHTGALASSDLATEALFEQAGIIRTQTLSQLFDLAIAFSNQPLPAGKRVAVMTNAGGPAILATDAIERNELSMAKLMDKTIQELRNILPEEASVNNPVDMIASANEITYQRTLTALLKDSQVDAVMIIIVRPPINTTPMMIAEKFKELLQNKSNKPIFVVLMAEKDRDCGLAIFQELGLPIYDYPESAAYGLAKMAEYAEWKKKPASKVKKITVDKASLTYIFEAAAAENRQFLKTSEIMTILSAYKFPVALGKLIQAPEEAIQFYETMKNPVVLKIESEDIIHKSDSGCVRINLKDVREIRQAYEDIMQKALKISRPEKIGGMVVQEMVQGKVEIALGMNRDPNYGPLLMFGMGGIFVELYRDVCFRLAPITERDAREMIRNTRAFQLLQGFRGSEPIDLEVIADSLIRLSQLSTDWPEISEMDLNPFVVAPQLKNCKIVDARIKIHVKK